MSAIITINGLDLVEPKTVSKNNMIVSWEFTDSEIQFTMSAPTKGWIAIGFNEVDQLTDTYLIMGRIVDNKIEVVEYYILNPGNYIPLSFFAIPSQVVLKHGVYKMGRTTIKFSLPNSAISKYNKRFIPEDEYYLLMAYSAEKDFQHHSLMRTSLGIIL